MQIVQNVVLENEVTIDDIKKGNLMYISFLGKVYKITFTSEQYGHKMMFGPDVPIIDYEVVELMSNEKDYVYPCSKKYLYVSDIFTNISKSYRNFRILEELK